VKLRPHGNRSLEEFDFARPRVIQRLRRKQAMLDNLRAVLEMLPKLGFSLLFVLEVAAWDLPWDFRLLMAVVLAVAIGMVWVITSNVAKAITRRKEILTREIARLEREHQALSGREAGGP
jgi:heme exporter protein D